ncbi:MAG: RNA polymerase sigma factor [Bacteroidetes bacterium]|nr:RNA polymerase sigma factor [Bacteroidota bacterium]
MTTAEYNKCVDQFSDGLYRFILKNIKDEDKAQDIVQDTFEKVWLKVGDVDFEKAKSYIFTTGYRTMIDVIRHDKRISNWDEVNEFEHLHHKQYNDLKTIVNKALNTLNEVQKSVIMLRDYEGYSYEEIAKITGLTLAQVKVYIFRGRQNLKEYIGKLENVL